MAKSRRKVGGYIWKEQVRELSEATRSLCDKVGDMRAVVEEHNLPFRDVLLKQLDTMYKDINKQLWALDELKDISGAREHDG